MNTGRFNNFLKWVDILLLVATGALFTILTWDIIGFMSNPREYAHLIGTGSLFGCNYKSVNSYLLVATVSTIITGVAFGIGFVFKTRAWSVSSRIMTISLMYIVNYVITRFFC